jgi:putative sensory transduction regulator
MLVQRRAFILMLGIAFMFSWSSSVNAMDVQEKPKSTPDIVTLLEKSGYSYSKVREGVWEIPGTGKNLKEFGIRLVVAEDVLLVMVKLVDRKDVKLQPALMTRLLELNHKFDWIKIALSDDMLYLRMDTHVRLVDSQELKYLVEQIANATDETYPQIKQFVTGAK